MLKKILLIVAVAMFGCALPPPSYEKQNFVPKAEVLGASLYNDGATLYKAGRLIDSELKFRQAGYLFPKAENIKSSLALVLRSNELFEESIDIYLELIASNPKMTDYKFALAEAYFRNSQYSEAAKYYDLAMQSYETDGLLPQASSAARSLSALYFLIGEEEQSLCYSELAYAYMATFEQLIRHGKTLTALNFTQEADTFLEPQMQANPPTKDPNLIKMVAAIKFSEGDLDNAKKLIDASADYQNGTGAQDIEINILQKLINPVDETNDQKAEETPTAQKADEITTINESLLLYWPVELVKAYHENKAKEEEAAKESE